MYLKIKIIFCALMVMAFIVMPEVPFMVKNGKVLANEYVYEDFTYTESDNGIIITGYNGAGGDVVIPELIDGKTVTGIGEQAFYFCYSLTGISLPNSVTTIGTRAFDSCSSLTSVSLPDSLVSIGFSAFGLCQSLTDLRIPDSVTSIGAQAFLGCTGLTEIVIPPKVTKIDVAAFNVCTGLTDITIPDGVTSIEDNAFGGCTGLTVINIPDSVRRIGDFAFSGCTGLTSIKIPEGLVYIHRCAFFDCTGLTSVILPNSTIVIEYSAFYGCSNLTMISLPNNVNTILDNAFASCTNLTGIIIPESVTSIANSAFQNCNNLTIYGKEDTFAQNYAEERNIPFTVLGGGRGENLEIDSSKTSHISIVVKDSGSKNIIAHANVDLNGTIAVSDDSGTAEFENVSNGILSLNVSANGYSACQTSIIAANPQVTKTIYLTKGTNKPIATSLTVLENGEIRNLFSESNFCVTNGDTTSFTLTSYINWQGQTPGTVKLVGGKKSLAFTGNKLSVALGHEFSPGTDFKLALYDAGGKLVNSRKVYISIIEGEMELKIKADLSRINFPLLESLPIDLPFFNHTKFKFDLGDMLKDSDFTVSIDDGKVKIKLGAKEDKWEHKDYFKGKWGSAGKKMKMRMIGSDSVDLTIFLDCEIPIETLRNGGAWKGDFGFVITGSEKDLSRNTKKLYTVADLKQQLAVGVIPIVVTAKVSVGLEAKITADGTTEDYTAVTWSGSITPQSTIRGSVGAGAAKVANIGLFGQGKGDLKVNLAPKFNIEPKITLDFGAELEVGWFKFEKKLITATWPEEAEKMMMTAMEGEGHFVPIGRDYLGQKNSVWLGDQGANKIKLAEAEVTNKEKTTLLTNAFPNAYADIAEDIVIFSQDDLTRTPINALKLVYSTRDDSGDDPSWTEPVAVDDDATADGCFSLAKGSGNTVFAAWENIKEVLPEDMEMNQVYGKSEIEVGKFTGTGWDTITLTDNSIADFQPQIKTFGNQAVCAWLSNTENDIFCTSGVTSVNYAVYNDIGWGEVASIHDVGHIAGYSVAYNGTDICFALDKDLDEDNSTIDDREIFVYQTGGSEPGASRVTVNDYLDQGCEITYHEGKFKLVWVTEEGIKIINDLDNMMDETTIADNEGHAIGGYGVKIVQNNEKLNLIWQEEKDGFANLAGAYYLDGKWSSRVDILNGEFDVKNFDACLEDDGSFNLVYLEKENTGTDLCLLGVVPTYNIRVSNPAYNDNQYYKEEETDFSCDVTVTGEEKIDGATISLWDGAMKLAGKSYPDLILPGETKEFSLSWLPDEFRDEKNLTLKVLPDQVPDFDLRDNSADIQMGYADAAVGTTYFEEEEEGYLLNSYITNIGSVPLEHAVFKLLDQNDNVVYSEEINGIDVDKLYLVQYRIPLDEPVFIDGVALYYALVETASEEPVMCNNKEMAVIKEFVQDKRDLNGDRLVNIQDLTFLARDWGLKITDSGFNRAYDLNSDEVIDLYDLVLIARGILK